MKIILLITAVLLNSIALHAEVKPEGTVLVNFCGRPSKQIEVCIASSKQGPEKSVVLMRNTMQKTQEFMLADKINRTPEGMLGAARFAYVTSLFQKQGNYIIEKKVEIKTTRVVYPNAPLKAELFINEKKLGSEFELEPMFHTQ